MDVTRSNAQCNLAISDASRSTVTLPPRLPSSTGVGSTPRVRRWSASTFLTNSSSVRPSTAIATDHGRPPRTFFSQTDSKELGQSASYELAVHSAWNLGALHRIVFRSKWRTGRRFELARLLGDLLLTDESDRLYPATRARTYRQ